MLISPIHSDDFACIPIFVEFRAVTGNPPTQSHKSVMNQGHIQGKREENRSSKKRRGTGEKKFKKQIKKQIVYGEIPSGGRFPDNCSRRLSSTYCSAGLH